MNRVEILKESGSASMSMMGCRGAQSTGGLVQVFTVAENSRLQEHTELEDCSMAF